jgi:hypothetical protein
MMKGKERKGKDRTKIGRDVEKKLASEAGGNNDVTSGRAACIIVDQSGRTGLKKFIGDC